MITSLNNTLCRNIGISSLFLLLGIVGCSNDMMVNTLASRNAGMKQYNEGQYAEAAGTFRTTLRANPSDYPSHYFLGASLAKMGSYEQAIEQYKTCLELMTVDLVGREDYAFRMQALNSLADAIVASKDSSLQSVAVKNLPAWENQFLMAKVNRGNGDADAALENYSQAALLVPTNFDVARDYGLYLLQLNQNEKARAELKQAYLLNPKDQQVATGLRRLGVVPGPSLKSEDQLARPYLPVGPLPEIELSAPAADRTSPKSAGAAVAE